VSMKPEIDKPLILVGAGGHARVLLSTLLLEGSRLLGFVEIGKSKPELLGIRHLGGDEAVFAYDPAEVQLVNGVGSAGAFDNRVRVHDLFRSRNYHFASVIHPSAIIAPEVSLAAGVQIMAGAILQTGCAVEENCIINTGARVDHDCVISAHAHVAPGAVLSGNVHVGARAHIGAGATVIQGVRVGDGAVVGAGAVVLSNVPAACTVVGVPARPMRAGAQRKIE
jgi:sugar O-acyltransferase (sialic acid O-acetyltransferase NeuD family)